MTSRRPRGREGGSVTQGSKERVHTMIRAKKAEATVTLCFLFAFLIPVSLYRCGMRGVDRLFPDNR
jgi:hypothetical protein